MDFEGIGRVATNTTLAACAGGLVAMFWVYPRVKKWDVGITVNGFLGGLVAITCPCYWVDPLGAIIIGAHRRCDRGARRRLPRVAADRRPDRCRRRCTASAASGARSASGCSPPASTACPAPTGRGHHGAPVEGLFYGGGADQLVAQIIGSAVITVATLGRRLRPDVRASRLTRTLRVSEEGELEGLDIHEHGGPAYHMEFGMGTSYTTQQGDV